MCKKTLISILFVILCVISTGCNGNSTESEKQDSFAEPEKRLLADIPTNTKVCYGQGYETDENNRPIGAISSQEDFGGYDAMFIGDEDENVIYLTFDEGYENGYTEKILDTLKEKKVTATFYVTLDYVKKCPDIVKRMIDEGHSVGNHTCNHPSLPDCNEEQVRSEIKELEDYVSRNFGGYKTTTIRPPKGEFSARTLKIAQDMGYKTVLWSFAYSDWDVDNQPDKEKAFDRITKATHNGAVYLLHAVSETNADILGDVIDYWQGKGYEIKAVK